MEKSHLNLSHPSGTKAFNKVAAKYADGKGTLKLPLDKPLPLDLIRKIAKLQVTENLKKTGTKYGKRS